MSVEKKAVGRKYLEYGGILGPCGRRRRKRECMAMDFWVLEQPRLPLLLSSTCTVIGTIDSG